MWLAPLVDGSLWRVPTTRMIPPSGVHLDLPTQFLDNALQFPQSLDQLDLALARGLLGRRIWVFRTRPARGATGRGEDTWDLGAATIGAWHVLVAADFSPATCHAAARVEALGRRLGGCVDGRARVGGVGMWSRLGLLLAGIRRCAIEVNGRLVGGCEALGVGLDWAGRVGGVGGIRGI